MGNIWFSWNKSSNKEKYLGIGMSVLIIILVFMIGPAQAFTLGLTVFSNNNIVKGQDTSTIATIFLRGDDRVNISQVELYINNTSSNTNNSIICKFDILGNVISGCDGVNIMLINDTSSFGYGYGYSYGYNFGYGYGQGKSNGELSYNITIQSDNFSIGDYKVYLKVNLGSKEYDSAEQNLRIREKESPGNVTVKVLDTQTRSSGGWGSNFSLRNNSINGINGGDKNRDNEKINPNNGENGTANNNLSENQTIGSGQNGIYRITGAVIGGLGSTGGLVVRYWFIIVALLAIIIAGFLIRFKVRKGNLNDDLVRNNPEQSVLSDFYNIKPENSNNPIDELPTE